MEQVEGVPFLWLLAVRKSPRDSAGRPGNARPFEVKGGEPSGFAMTFVNPIGPGVGRRRTD